MNGAEELHILLPKLSVNAVKP